MLVRDVLNLKGGALYSIEPTATLAAAVDLMVSRDVGSLVIMESGKMTGMLTFREVLQTLHRAGGTLAGAQVRDVMVKDPICGNPGHTIDELRDLMTRHHVRYLPVCEGDALVGVVSFHDVAKAVIKETNMENRLLRRYIETQTPGEKQ